MTTPRPNHALQRTAAGASQFHFEPPLRRVAELDSLGGGEGVQIAPLEIVEGLEKERLGEACGDLVFFKEASKRTCPRWPCGRESYGRESLPPEVADVMNYNGLTYNHQEMETTLRKLISFFVARSRCRGRKAGSEGEGN